MIADIFSRVDKAERIGSGLPRIMRLISEAELPDPIIESNSFFEITFKRDKRYTTAIEYSEVKKEIKEIASEGLSARHADILQVLEGKNLTPSEIIESLQDIVSPRTLSRDLQSLKDKGYLDSEGPKGWAR